MAGLVRLILLAALAAVIGAGAGSVMRGHAPPPVSTKTSVYDRVTASRTLRCGYIAYPPVLVKDPNTGELSGFIVDLMAEIGQRLNLKIVWAEEVGWANNIEGLRQGHYDAVCVGYWRSAKEGQFLDYSIPFFYSALGAFVRVNDHRFDADLGKLNDPNVALIVADGELAEVVAHADFPRMKVRTLPNLVDISQVMTEVATGKADVTFAELMHGAQYTKFNPGKLRLLNPDHPLRVFQNTLALPPNEPQLKAMIDSAIYEMRDAGIVEKLLRHYEPAPGTMYRVATPYAVPTGSSLR